MVMVPPATRVTNWPGPVLTEGVKLTVASDSATLAMMPIAAPFVSALPPISDVPVLLISPVTSTLVPSKISESMVGLLVAVALPPAPLKMPPPLRSTIAVD